MSSDNEAKRLLFRRLLNDPGHGLNLSSGGEIKVFSFFSSQKFHTFLHEKESMPWGVFLIRLFGRGTKEADKKSALQRRHTGDFRSSSGRDRKTVAPGNPACRWLNPNTFTPEASGVTS